MSTQPTSEPIPCTVTKEGETLTFNPNVDGHLSIVGAAGSGKTAMMKDLIRRVTAQGTKVWVCDPLCAEVADVEPWPDVEEVATTVDDVVQVVHDAHREMEQRYADLASAAVTRADLEPVLIVLDEPQRMRASATHRQLEVLERAIGEIARLGRSARVHLVWGSSAPAERPDVQFLDGVTRDQFGARLSLGLLASAQATDHAE